MITSTLHKCAMDHHAIFVSAATRLLGPDITETLKLPPQVATADTSLSVPVTCNVPVCPDDLMSIFRTLRDRNLKFIAPKRHITNGATLAQDGMPQTMNVVAATSSVDASAYLSKHTFMHAVICAIDPLLQCDVHIAKRVKQTIDSTMISITSDTNGVVKRFRAACGIRQPSAEDMRASLYETDIIMLDSHLNDIAIFQMACSLKIGILLSTRNGARVIPSNISIHDRAILIKEMADKKYECCSGVSNGTLLNMLKKQVSMKDGSVMPSMKVSEIRSILVDQIGVGCKQASEILSTVESNNNDAANDKLSKKNMIRILDILKSG